MRTVGWLCKRLEYSNTEFDRQGKTPEKPKHTLFKGRSRCETPYCFCFALWEKFGITTYWMGFSTPPTIFETKVFVQGVAVVCTRFSCRGCLHLVSFVALVCNQFLLHSFAPGPICPVCFHPNFYRGCLHLVSFVSVVGTRFLSRLVGTNKRVILYWWSFKRHRQFLKQKPLYFESFPDALLKSSLKRESPKVPPSALSFAN